MNTGWRASADRTVSFGRRSGYDLTVSDIVKQAIEALQALPPAMQEEAAHMILRYAGDEGEVYRLTPEEAADLDEADREIERGEIATPREVEAVFAKYRV